MIKNKGKIVEAIKLLKEDKNNAVSYIFEEAKNSSGLLENATVTIKDNYATSEAPTQASSKILEGFMPGYNATVVDKLQKAGAAIVGKTHLDELAMEGTGQYSAFGPINHPQDDKRIIGGSSSGAAATMFKSITIAIGSDTGDSVRIPASYSGLVGFKPSYGAVSRYGLFGFAPSLDTVAWLTHNVEDTIVASQVLFGKDPKDMTSIEIDKPDNTLLKPKKVAFLKDGTNSFNSKAQEAQDTLFQELKNEGILVEYISIEQKLLEAIGITYSIISYSESSSTDANLNGIAFGQRQDGKNWKDIMDNTRTLGFGNRVQRRFTLGSYFLATENQVEIFQRAQKVRRLIVNAFNKVLDNYDLLIFPTADVAPEIIKNKKENWYTDLLIYANFIGNPSITIPWIKDKGMPVGLQLGSKIYSDKKLLSHALYLEKLLGGKNE